MKKLGQHFLKSKKIVGQIIEAAELKPNDIVLEVGPGKGILTEALLKTGAKIIAIEKDKQLVRYLTDRLGHCKNLKLIHGDILKIENYKLKIENYKAVSNIPYYITSRFLRQFLTAKNQPTMMVLMVQKEVAERICASAGQMSLLAISVQAYGKPKIITRVPKNYFSPTPKVDSAILKIKHISKSFFAPRTDLEVGEKAFFELIKKGFSQKRKMLKNNLKIDKKILKKCGLSEKVRPQELSLENWLCLYRLSPVRHSVSNRRMFNSDSTATTNHNRKYRSLDPK